ncbi:SGNH family hydrolase [uncultured Helicobacter sp.]|uniref:SGNH/GDSL hydrolase family protein n=1 Tax=uncultured Helicobacter sp. TaxID=175537 RepID=UPI0026ED5756|nr:SGNH family hydrolase [uncultured Helicobacter sp.]
MQQAKFIFIAFFTLLQLLIILHSSILIYIEQQYHNFSESQHPLTQVLNIIYQNTMLQENILFTYTDGAINTLNTLSSNFFSFHQSPQKTAAKEQSKTPHSTSSLKPPISNTTPPPHNPHSEVAKSMPIENTRHFFNHKESSHTEIQAEVATNQPQKIRPPIVESYTPIRAISNPRIKIEEGSSVLLVGDSMMQGVAPYMLKTFKKMNLQGINLSKHSTGLTYKHYFDWAEAIKDAFSKNDNIALVVVLLGANDPWTIKKNIAFKSPLWEEIYTQRIEEILIIAQSNGARIVWYEIPSVREKSLNDKLMYLNSLYEREMRSGGEYFLQSNGIVTQGGKYSAFIKNKSGKSVQVRDDDGVHFTSKGYQIMANIFLNALEISPLEDSIKKQ